MFLMKRFVKKSSVLVRVPGMNTIRINGITAMSQNKVPVLYGDEASPPVRFVMMTASALNIEFNFQMIDLFLGENKTKLFSKINPLQKVPALDTGNQVICDSHAIALYLCRISKDRELYPEDVLLRARVDEMLFFNSGSLFPIDSQIFTEYFSGKPVDNNKIDRFYEHLDYLGLKLKANPWLAGDKMTLSDLCCGATVSSLQLLVPLSERHANVTRWLKNLQQLPCFEINARGLKRLALMVEKIKTI